MIPNEYELTSKSKFGIRNVRNWTKSLVSGVWFLSPEAGGTPRRELGGTLKGHRQSQPFKDLYKNPLEIRKGIPSEGITAFDFLPRNMILHLSKECVFLWALVPLDLTSKCNAQIIRIQAQFCFK